MKKLKISWTINEAHLNRHNSLGIFFPYGYAHDDCGENDCAMKMHDYDYDYANGYGFL